MQIVHIIIAIHPSPAAFASVVLAPVAFEVVSPGCRHLVVPGFLAEDVEVCYPVDLVVYCLLLVACCLLVLSLPKDAALVPGVVPSVVAVVDYGVFYPLSPMFAN